MKRKGIALLLALLMVLTLTISVQASSGGSSTEKMRHSVVCVEIGVDGILGYKPLATGTGFFVDTNQKDPEYLLTNYHVIEGFLTLGRGNLKTVSFESFFDWYVSYLGISLNALTEEEELYLRAIIAQEWSSFMGNASSGNLRSRIRIYFGNNDYEDGFLVDFDENMDAALLHLAAPTSKRSHLPLCAPVQAMVGKSVFTVGYPGVSDNEYFESISQRGETDATVNKGVVSLLKDEVRGVKTVQTDAAIAHGNSGGPLVFENGAAIGINSWGFTNSDLERVYYALDISMVFKLLDRNNVKYEILSWPEKPFPTVWVIVILAVVLLAALAFFFLRKKSSSSSTNGGSGNSGDTGGGGAIGSSGDVGDSGDIGDPGAGTGYDSGYRIQVLSGALANKRVMLPNNQPLILGRTPESAGIVFPNDAKGISRRHCKVWFEKEEIWIQDLGSTYGTFVDPGKRLMAEQPMKLAEGQKFWLGSKEQTLVVVRKRNV